MEYGIRPPTDPVGLKLGLPPLLYDRASAQERRSVFSTFLLFVVGAILWVLLPGPGGDVDGAVAEETAPPAAEYSEEASAAAARLVSPSEVDLAVSSASSKVVTASTEVPDPDSGPETYHPPQNRTHRVVAGDTLSGLSAAYAVPVDDIMDANALTDSLIVVGQKLAIPAALD